jgi:hypothetical protein
MRVSSASAQRVQGVFSNHQPVYAAHGVATFPVTQDKIPAIRGYSRVGLPGSAKLAQKFPSAGALGFIAGRRSRITVLDVDTTNEKVLSDALARHGKSNLVVRTGSGKFHAYYRHDGERRRIRPWGSDLPIDIIGAATTGLASVAIAPPSVVTKGSYEIIVAPSGRARRGGNTDDVAPHRSANVLRQRSGGPASRRSAARLL